MLSTASIPFDSQYAHLMFLKFLFRMGVCLHRIDTLLKSLKKRCTRTLYPHHFFNFLFHNQTRFYLEVVVVEGSNAWRATKSSSILDIWVDWVCFTTWIVWFWALSCKMWLSAKARFHVLPTSTNLANLNHSTGSGGKCRST